MSKVTPIIEQWYTAKELEDIFEVVAFDETTKTVEIQYFNGEIEEIDYDIWSTLHLRAIEQPKDWTGPFEIYSEDSDEFGTEANDDPSKYTIVTDSDDMYAR